MSKQLIENLKKIINKDFIINGAARFKEEDVKKLAGQLPDIQVLIKQTSPLMEFEDKIFQMMHIVKSFAEGKQLKQSWETISACAFVLGYMIEDVDLVPDFLEDIGEMDDVLVVRAMVELFHDEFYI